MGLLNETHVEDEMQFILLENPVEWLLKTSCAMNLLAQQSLQAQKKKKMQDTENDFSVSLI